MTRTRSAILLMLLLFAPTWAHGQRGRSEVEEGNRRFQAGEYGKARESYRTALEQVPGSSVATFNLGGSEYKLDEFSGAEKSFLEAIESGNPELLAQSHYNLANSLFKQGRIEESIEGYKQALRLSPADPEAKHNLEFALKQQQEQEKQQQQNQDQDQSSQEDQDQKDQEDQEEGESGQQPNEQPEQNPEQEGEGEDQEEDPGESSRADEDAQRAQDQPAEREQEQDEDQADGDSDAGPAPVRGQLTKEEASRLLEAIQEDLQSLRREQLKKLKRSRAEKDW